MSKNDGGPAFPVKVKTKRVIKRGDGFESIEGEDCFVGMTLRDYFAALWLAGYVANPGTDNLTQEDAANLAYAMADAMLKEREK